MPDGSTTVSRPYLPAGIGLAVGVTTAGDCVESGESIIIMYHSRNTRVAGGRIKRGLLAASERSIIRETG